MKAPAQLEVKNLFEWTTHENQAVKYYSGKAIYSTEFDFSGDVHQHLILDMGKVDGLATIILNGKRLETLWRYPYQSEVKGYLQKGKNRLQVELVNCWWNRLIGDQQPGVQPLTKTAFVGWKADTPLLPSGLIGPVKILTIKK